MLGNKLSNLKVPFQITDVGNMTIGEECGVRQEKAIYLQTNSLDDAGNDTVSLEKSRRSIVE